MIQQFKDYATTKAYTDATELPKGGYVCKVLNAQVKEGKNGKYVQIAYDIAEGDFKDYFKKLYDAKKDEDKKWSTYYFLNIPKDDGSEKDGWTKRTFKTFTNALEDSNEGYKWDWDEKKWKNKLIGLVFGETGTVIEGKEVVYTDCRFPIEVQTVREGKAPEAKFKARNGYGDSKPATTQDGSTEFMNIPDDINEELPF